uniref:Uncharacterized protein n=1 Tax=Solanum tuberosum TaxID=4113 RepID=M1DEB9_SOLTU
MRAMDVRIMEIMGAMMIAMIKSRIRMRANIPEEIMRKMLNTARMVKIERKKALAVVPMMMPEHATLPTPRMKVSRSNVYGYTSSNQSHPRGRRECATLKSKDTISYTSQGTSVINGGTQVPAKEPTIKGVMDALTECSNIQGKKDLSCGHQGTIAKLNTFAITNEQSVNVSLSLSEPIDSLPHIDNVLVESVDTLVDPIDDRIDSSSKINLYPPSVDIYPSSFLCNDCVDQPVCTSVINGGTQVPAKEPIFKGVMDALTGCSNIQGKEDLSCGHQGTIVKLNTFAITNEQSVKVSLSLSEPIDSLPHIDKVLVESLDTLVDPINDRIESSSKIDLCPPSVDIYPSSLFCNDCVDQPVYVEITPSGVNHESSIVLDSYTFYNNPIWCEAFPPKDGNLFLEDESTLVGKECDEEKGGVCFPIPFSSWCVPIVNGMTHEFESISSHTHENTLEEVELRDTFLYNLFTFRLRSISFSCVYLLI